MASVQGEPSRLAGCGEARAKGRVPGLYQRGMDGYAAAKPAQANGLKFEHLIPPETADLEYFFRCGLAVATAHHLKLIRICPGANIVNSGRGKGRGGAGEVRCP